MRQWMIVAALLPTLGGAVDRYLTAHPVEWRDWEDEK